MRGELGVPRVALLAYICKVMFKSTLLGLNPPCRTWSQQVRTRATLGEFEHLVLATALRVEDAFGAELMRELEERTGRQVQGGSLYVAIDRLERKGFVVTRLGDPSDRRAGRPKRYVQVTAAGVRALAEQRDALLRAWRGIEETLDQA